MGGKAALLLVLGFSSLFAIMGTEMLKSANDSTDNYVNYFEQTKAHNIAVSGANMAANEIFITKYWTAGYSGLQFDNGSLSVTVDSINTFDKVITSIGEFDGVSDTVIVYLQPKNFAQYGNFYNSMAAWAATGDTFSGPFHTNDFLKCYGDPVFLGYATTQNGVDLYHNDGTDHPEFHGGLQEGVFIPLEFDTSIIRQAAYTGGKIFSDTTGSNQIIDTKFVLLADGTADYSINIGSSGWSPVINEPLSTLAPNGVIYVEKGNVYIEGTLNGQVSIVASTKGNVGAGKIHITDDLRYNNNPLSDPSSTEMLGLIAERNVQVDFNLATGDLDIHASMYSQLDGLVIEDYASYPTANNMNIIGGVIGEKVRATAKYAWNGTQYVPTNGYSYVHKFDERFNKTVPPFFPKTKYYKVVAWYE